MPLVPIACRFVPLDQWFVSHFDDAAKVRHVKLWCLSKCNLVQSPGTPPRRAVSPIVFAPTTRAGASIDTLDDGYSEDDEHSDHDLRPSVYPLREHRHPQPQSSPLVDQYVLLSFSTGAILDDEFALSWHNLRPYELLEMHPLGFVAPLQRDVLADYIQPYFQAKARVLRSVWNNKSGRLEAPGIDIGHKTMDKLAHRLDSLSTKSGPSHSDKKRKTKVEWKARWVVIHRGTLSLCKEDVVTNPPIQQFPLNSITAIRGADALERAFTIIAPRAVCIKFRPRQPSLVASTPPSSPVSDINVRAPDSSPDVKQTTDPGEWFRDTSNAGDWMVLDMLDDHAFSSILRILHRQATHPMSSSFVPSSSIVTTGPSFFSYDTTPYPEWRINTVENARKAGMGDIGKAMAWVLWSEKGLGDTLLGNVRHHRQAFTQETQYKATPLSDVHYGYDDDSDEESEVEWEGWMRDLERQNRVKQQSEMARKVAASSAHGRSLPSPPLSEASPSGSPRVRSPSLSLSTHIQYPNIGNVIQPGGYRGHAQEKHKNTTVSTVSVGMPPFPRRRSSTLLTEMGAPKREYDRHEREPFLSRAGARTTSISASLRSPSTALRHARSSSNLRASPSPYGSDATESVQGPSSPKRHNAFVRGMSLRAGKLVRGLESAIDFVDENT